jgi:hypothetical protein
MSSWVNPFRRAGAVLVFLAPVMFVAACGRSSHQSASPSATASSSTTSSSSTTPSTTATTSAPLSSQTTTSSPGNGPGVSFPQALSPGTTDWNGNSPENALTNSGANPNIFWQPTADANAPVTYEVVLGAPAALSAVTSTWYSGFPPPSAYHLDTSSDGVSWTTRFTTAANASRSRTDVFPTGQVTAGYLRMVITAFSSPCGGCGYAELALVQFGWDGHFVTFPQAYYPSTLPNSATANTTATWGNGVPDNIFNGGPGGTSWWQPVGASGNTGALVLAVDLGNPRTIFTIKATWLNATFCPPHATCTGFNPINYTILTSATGAQNSWTRCTTVSGNSSFTTTDPCSVSNAQYVEYDITSWNSVTPFNPMEAYGPAANSLTIS